MAAGMDTTIITIMTIPTIITTTDTVSLLRLAQWLSPAFPLGAFAASHGLEWAVAEGGLARDQVGGWVADVLEFGAGWSDAVLLAHALRPGADRDALDDLARALAPSAERLAESLDQGSAFAMTLTGMGQPMPPRMLPVAVGAAAYPLGLPVPVVVALYLQGFAGMIVAAATRFVPLGQTEGQRILADLHPLIERLAVRAAGATLDDIATSTLGADLAAMRHETQETRIFRT